MLSVGKVVVFLARLLQYLAKNMALFSKQILGAKNPCTAILRLKIRYDLTTELGGGGGERARPLGSDY